MYIDTVWVNDGPLTHDRCAVVYFYHKLPYCAQYKRIYVAAIVS